MSRCNTLRCAAAGIVLAVSLLLPGLAAAQGGGSDRQSEARSESIFSPVRLWDAFLDLLAGWRPAFTSTEGDNGVLIDPNG